MAGTEVGSNTRDFYKAKYHVIVGQNALTTCATWQYRQTLLDKKTGKNILQLVSSPDKPW